MRAAKVTLAVKKYLHLEAFEILSANEFFRSLFDAMHCALKGHCSSFFRKVVCMRAVCTCMEYFRANKQIGVEKGGGEPVDLLQVGPQLFA